MLAISLLVTSMKLYKGLALVSLGWLMCVQTVFGQGYELDVLSNESFCPFIPMVECANQDLQADFFL